MGVLLLLLSVALEHYGSVKTVRIFHVLYEIYAISIKLIAPMSSALSSIWMPCGTSRLLTQN